MYTGYIRHSFKPLFIHVECVGGVARHTHVVIFLVMNINGTWMEILTAHHA